MANVKHFQLTPAGVKALTKPGTYTDGDTLTLRVSWNEEKEKLYKQWVQRISISGKQRNIGLGGYPKVGLADARKMAKANALAVEQGLDPIQEKRAARREASDRAAVKTFWEIAQEVIEKDSKSRTSPKTSQNWTNTLLKYAVPLIGKKRPREITIHDIEAILKPIWIEKRETANKVLRRIRAIFEYAMTKELCEANPADARIVKILPNRPKNAKNHLRSMPFAELPTALNIVHSSGADYPTKLAVEFLALTAGRSGEVRVAKWSEVDLNSKKWVVPAERMKAGKEHRVPLSRQALDILEKAAALESQNNLIFTNPRTGKPYSDSTFSKLFRELEIPAVPHGMRSCFKNWTRDELRNPDHVMVEIALSHEVGNEVEQAYGTSDMFEKRRGLMQQWADFLAVGMEQNKP